MKHDLEQDFDGRGSGAGAASGGAIPANAKLAEKEAALTELAAGILQEADEEGRCSALYSRGFFKGVAFCIHANGFASFLPDDRLEVFAIRNAYQPLKIELIAHRDAQPLAYRTAFAQMLRQQALEEHNAICAWVDSRPIA